MTHKSGYQTGEGLNKRSKRRLDGMGWGRRGWLYERSRESVLGGQCTSLRRTSGQTRDRHFGGWFLRLRHLLAQVGPCGSTLLSATLLRLAGCAGCGLSGRLAGPGCVGVATTSTHAASRVRSTLVDGGAEGENGGQRLAVRLPLAFAACR